MPQTYVAFTNNIPPEDKPYEPPPGAPWWHGIEHRPIGEAMRIMVERIKELEAKAGPPTCYFIPDDGVFIEADGTVRRIKPGDPPA